MRRALQLLTVTAIVVGASSSAASARLLHPLSVAQAYSVADKFGEAAGERYEWADLWGDNCERETPWTFSCDIEIWSEHAGGADCWRYFEVASSAWSGRIRTEGWEPWACDPWPSEEVP